MKSFLILFFCITLTYSQTKQSVISSGRYYYGEATAQEEQEARPVARETQPASPAR